MELLKGNLVALRKFEEALQPDFKHIFVVQISGVGYSKKMLLLPGLAYVNDSEAESKIALILRKKFQMFQRLKQFPTRKTS